MESNLRQLFIGTLAMVLSACGDRDPRPGTAQQQAEVIEKVGIDASQPTAGANLALKADAKGCKDRAKAEELVAASKLDDPSTMIKIWSEGMQDRTCRGFTSGLVIAVERVEGRWACVLPGDEPDNKQCFWVLADAI